MLLHRIAAARQARMVAAAVFPSDDSSKQANFLSKLTAGERAAVDLGSLASWPGHGKMLNLPADKTVEYQSWSGKFPAGMVGGESLPSDIARDVFEAKVNPPVNFHDRLAVGEYYTGLPNGFMGGVVDPLHRKALVELHGITNDHAVYVNPSAQNLTEAKHPSDTSSNAEYLEQDMTSTARVGRVLQTRFDSSAEAKGFTEVPAVKSSEFCSENQPGRLEKEVKYHLGVCGAIFDIQGSTGSVNDDEIKVDVVTDHASTALYWRNLLHPNRPKSFYENTEFTGMVQIYHVSGYQLERERVIEEFGGPKPADLGLTHESFALVDPYSKPATALISGNVSLETSRDLVAFLNSLILFEELDTLTLPGHATYNVKENSVEVLINASTVPSTATLFGAHHLTLSPDGLGRVWNGLTRPTENESDRKNFNLITKNQDGTTTTTTILPRKINDDSSVAKPRGFYTDATKQTPSSRVYTATGGAKMTLSKQGAKEGSDSCLRPNTVALEKTSLVFNKEGVVGRKEVTPNEAGKLFVEELKKWGYQYGDDETIAKALEEAMAHGVKCYVAGTAAPKAAPATPEPAPATPAPKKRATKKKKN